MAKTNKYYEASLFPDFKDGQLLPPKITPNLVSNSDIRDALSAAIYAASQIELTDGSIYLRPKAVRNIYFRAALTELLRIEDITTTSNNSLKFDQSKNPLLHILKLLRNYNVHIDKFQLESGYTTVSYKNEEAIYESFILQDLRLQELRKLRSANGYTDDQLLELISLWDFHQRRFGVIQLLYNSCLHLAKLTANF